MSQADTRTSATLAMVITEVGPKAVLLVVPRLTGVPLPADHQLWTDLRERLADTAIDLIDLLVVGERTVWSARGSADQWLHHDADQSLIW